jgi:hypothetical protein
MGMPILTYKAKIWPWIKEDINRLMVAEIRFLRCIGGKTEREKINLMSQMFLLVFLLSDLI